MPPAPMPARAHVVLNFDDGAPYAHMGRFLFSEAAVEQPGPPLSRMETIEASAQPHGVAVMILLSALPIM